MKRVLLWLCLLLFVSAAHAQDQKLGVGLMAGLPTGATAKYWLSREHAIDAAAGWTFGEHDAFQLHGDYLIHNFELLRARESALPVFVGAGARLNFDDDTVFGIRIPLGIAFVSKRNPIEIFWEVAPVFDIAPDAELDVNAAIGLRYYLR